MSLNPVRHLSPSGFLFFVLFRIGWAKPTPVNPLNFKKFRSGTRWVSIAGILANFLFGLLAAVIYAILMNTVGVPNTAMQYVYYLLDAIMAVNSFLALFNLIPIYPFDGFTFVSTYLKSDSKFLQNSIRNSTKILCGVILVCLLIELLFNVDILDWYLRIIYNFIYTKIAVL